MMERPWIVASSIVCVGLLAPASAFAQGRIADNDWRHDSRPTDAETKNTMFAAELRFGPYWPQVDDEFSSAPGPYERVFGTGPQFYFGLEFDFMPLRIPYVGMIGPGFGWGYTATSAKALISGTNTASQEDTSLSIMPMHLSLVARFDELQRRTGVPIVPYLKFGPALGVWNASTSEGTSVAGAGCTVDTPDAAGCTSGNGITWGLNFAIGGMLSLNWLDPRSANLLAHENDVAHAYLFGEWMDAVLTGFGADAMHVGSSTVVVGLAADF
ncbi:MAG: MXAN_2562 family outer membrane beta-barrel protein [Polyangiaceae bacterium]